MFTLPRQIYEGETALEEFIGFLEQENLRKIFIVTDKNLAELGLLEILLNALESFDTRVFDGVVPEPTLEVVEEGGRWAREFKPDVIIALGGGSVIDAAKGIWIKYENPEFDLETISPFRRIGVGRKSIFASIPTTSGTGSEVTLGVVYTVEREGRREKIALGSFELISNIVVLDPRFVRNLPKGLTIFTGLDALTHAVEALVATTANDFTDALAIKSIINIFEILPKLVENLDNIELRRRMHLTAMMAGMAFSNSGLGLAHGLGHALGAVLHVHHGRIVSLTLPYVVKYNMSDEASKEKYELIRRLLVLHGLAEDTEFYNQLYSFIKGIGGDVSLNKIVSKDVLVNKLNDIVELTIQDPDVIYNPVTPDVEAIEQLVMKMFDGEL